MKSEKRIFLVEDDYMSQLIVKEAINSFEDYQINFEIYTNGEDAIKRIKTIFKQNLELPDMFIIDINIPKKNGLDILDELKNITKFQYLPKIVMSSAALQEDIMRVYNYSCCNFISKSLDFNEYKNKIKLMFEYWFVTLELVK